MAAYLYCVFCDSAHLHTCVEMYLVLGAFEGPLAPCGVAVDRLGVRHRYYLLCVVSREMRVFIRQRLPFR